MAAKKRASGPTQPEAQRKNVQMLLRLPPDVAEDVRLNAKRLGVTASQLVTCAWRTWRAVDASNVEP